MVLEPLCAAVSAEVRARQLSPLTADLSDFPPTLCIGAECDLLLDDTLAFYGELTKAGVDVSLSLWSSLPHGCLHFVGAVGSVTEAAGSIVQFVDARGHGARGPFTPLARGSLSRRSAQPCARNGADAPALIDVEPVVRHRAFPAAWIARPSASPGDIISDDLAAGRRFSRARKAPAKSFGVSRSAYREAIRTLAAKGLVTVQPKVGTQGRAALSLALPRPDLLEWRFELAPDESLHSQSVRTSQDRGAERRRACGDAPERPGRPRLADALSRMASTNPRAGAWLNAIVAFHHELLDSGRNEALSCVVAGDPDDASLVDQAADDAADAHPGP